MSECERLDSYLDGALPREDAERFAAHLDCCEACLFAINEQRWIDGLLGDAAALEQPASELAERIVRRARESATLPLRRRLAFVAAAAAVVLAMFFVWRGEPDARQAAALRSGGGGGEVVARSSVPPIAVVFGGDDAIIVPVESDSPDVTIVEVYPTTRAVRRWEREALLQTTYVSHDGGR
jgi:anti-sigma factor RsiW